MNKKKRILKSSFFNFQLILFTDAIMLTNSKVVNFYHFFVHLYFNNLNTNTISPN